MYLCIDDFKRSFFPGILRYLLTIYIQLVIKDSLFFRLFHSSRFLFYNLLIFKGRKTVQKYFHLFSKRIGCFLQIISMFFSKHCHVSTAGMEWVDKPAVERHPAELYREFIFMYAYLIIKQVVPFPQLSGPDRCLLSTKKCMIFTE